MSEIKCNAFTLRNKSVKNICKVVHRNSEAFLPGFGQHVEKIRDYVCVYDKKELNV